MATYDSLTQGEKEILAVWERNTRGWVNTAISRSIVEARALKASLDASGGAGSILDSLDASEIIPNSGNIAGAHALTRAEWGVLRNAGLNNYLTSYDTETVRQIAAKAAGPLAGL